MYSGVVSAPPSASNLQRNGGRGGIPTAKTVHQPRATLPPPRRKNGSLIRSLCICFGVIFMLAMAGLGIFVSPLGDRLRDALIPEDEGTSSPTTPIPSASPTPSPSRAPTGPTVPPTPQPTSSPIPPTPQPTSSPTPNPTLPPDFPPVTRTNNDDYIGLYFVSDISAEHQSAFIQAADRWSAILAGNSILGTGPAGLPLCSLNAVLRTTTAFDHLAIGVQVAFIDGPFRILGSAGPCAFSGGLPILGAMNFDSADLDRLANDNDLEAVILHEMGHVLGIGTLFGSSLQDPVQFDSNGNTINPGAIQPKYTGEQGLAAYRSFTSPNEPFLPVEDGTTDGVSNGAGSGSANSHWDQDATPGELMTFQLSNDPRLSTISIQALLDIGYTSVDTNFADSFSINSNLVGGNLRGSSSNEHVVEMIDDILHFEIKELSDFKPSK